MRLLQVLLLWLGVLVVIAPAQEADASARAEFSADTEATYYVATDGSDSNDGRSENSPFETIQKAAEVVEPGHTVYLRDGVYTVPVELTVSGSEVAPITFASYPGEWAIIDGAGDESDERDDLVRVQGVSWNIFKNFEVRNSSANGIVLEYSDHNVFDNLVIQGNQGAGLALRDSSHNRLLNIEAYDNFDENFDGEHADGIAISSGRGNYIYNCHVYNNSDDGVDTWKSTESVIDGCISHHNGLGSDGDGNGFKLGAGENPNAATLIRRSIAYANRNTGFTTNGGGGIVMQNNTAFDNGVNFAAYRARDGSRSGQNRLINNLSFRGDNDVSDSTDESHNSWNLSISDPSFASTEPSEVDFLQLARGSPAIDVGTEVGLLYYGSAPDLGAYEYRNKTATESD